MSMNILVETRLASKQSFDLQNPILFPGEIGIEEELTGAKIGDGVTDWSRLSYISVSRDVIQNWYNIATGVTNSHLVTLPDLNYAYTVIGAESDALIEEVISVALQRKNYFEIKEDKTSTVDNCGILTLQSAGVQDVKFLNTAENKICKNINSIKFISLDKTEREYFFWDEDSHKQINDTLKEINNIKINVEQIASNQTSPTLEMIQAMTNGMPVFGLNKKGLVPGPTATTNYEYYFLNAKGQWTEIQLTANKIITSDGRTVQEKLDTLFSGQGNNNNTFLSIDTIPNNSTDSHFVGTVTGKTADKILYASGVKITGSGTSAVLMGAAWNDYAEGRKTKPIAPGRVVVENGDDTLSMATERLLLGGNIVSDTYGMLIGETDTAKTPIALCGRVLAYPNEDRSEYYAGAPVCTGPNGTVSIMTKDEVLHYPECIIGYVSAVPTYEEWNGKKVNGRIWIKVV